jgi:glycosyltransferase involved in cell wall biosynthesis
MTLLASFARVRQQQPGVRLRVSGVGPLDRAAHDQAAALGLTPASCEFLGYTLERDKRALMESFDVFVLPSLAEGTPNSLIEAMMMGLPIVATRVGGIPDMLGAAGVALLVPPDDVEALAAAMTLMARDADLRSRLRAAARERYERIHHPDAVLPVVLREYARTASRARERERDAPRGVGHPWEAPHDSAPAVSLLAHRRGPGFEMTPT